MTPHDTTTHWLLTALTFLNDTAYKALVALTADAIKRLTQRPPKNPPRDP